MLGQLMLWFRVSVGGQGQVYRRSCPVSPPGLFWFCQGWISLLMQANSVQQCHAHIQPFIFICIYIHILKHLGPDTMINKIQYYKENHKKGKSSSIEMAISPLSVASSPLHQVLKQVSSSTKNKQTLHSGTACKTEPDRKQGEETAARERIHYSIHQPCQSC